MTLIGHMQGDELDADERALIDDLEARKDAAIRASWPADAIADRG